MKIRALGLPRDMTQDELVSLFAEYGTVDSCTVVMDEHRNSSKGFGFVSMPDETEARAAIAALHGSKQGKRKIRVKASSEGE